MLCALELLINIAISLDTNTSIELKGFYNNHCLFNTTKLCVTVCYFFHKKSINSFATSLFSCNWLCCALLPVYFDS